MSHPCLWTLSSTLRFAAGVELGKETRPLNSGLGIIIVTCPEYIEPIRYEKPTWLKISRCFNVPSLQSPPENLLTIQVGQVGREKIPTNKPLKCHCDTLNAHHGYHGVSKHCLIRKKTPNSFDFCGFRSYRRWFSCVSSGPHPQKTQKRIISATFCLSFCSRFVYPIQVPRSLRWTGTMKIGLQRISIRVACHSVSITLQKTSALDPVIF